MPLVCFLLDFVRDKIKTPIMTVYLVIMFPFSSVNFLIELKVMFSGTWRGLKVVFLKILYLKNIP